MIDNLRELSEVVTKVANRIIEVATENTSSGQYYVDYDDVSDLISHEDFLTYFEFISNELWGREEVLYLDRDGDDFDVTCGLAWCKNYQPTEGEDFVYGYLDVRPAPSMAHLSDIGSATLTHLVTKGPFANLYGEELGVTESDKDYSKTMQPQEPVVSAPASMPDLPVSSMSYENLLITAQQSLRRGRPVLDLAFNVYGQDVSKPGIKEKDPELFKVLENAMKLEKYTSEFTRAGAFLYGQPVLVYTYELKNELAGLELDPEFHAQTAMMSAHLEAALKSYNVHITYGIETGDDTDKYCRPADEILAFVPANADPATIVQFEKDLGKVMEEMPFTQDSSWAAEQYTAVQAALPAYTSQHVNRWLSDHPSAWQDVAVKACEQLGSRVGALHEDILAARKIGDDKRLESIAGQCSFTAEGSNEYLEDCISYADWSIRMDALSPVQLFTEPTVDDKDWTKSEHFVIPRGELKAILQDLGCDPDLPLSTFLSGYSCDVAKEILAMREDREQKIKPTLDQQMKRAETRRQDPGQKDKPRDNERE